MTICPCCGSKLDNSLEEGCNACGARPVGPPLARPEHELPSYGRALATGAAGAALALTFLASTFTALLERKPFSLAFWHVVAAGETAAWRMKWTAAPLALLVLLASLYVSRQVGREPLRFTGRRLARVGAGGSAFVAVAIAVLIGVTVPERLRQRDMAAQAADDALRYSVHRVLLQYRTAYGTYPATAEDLRRLPDPDGSVAKVVASMSAGDYSPEANLAALPSSKSKGRGRRASAVRVRAVSAKAGTDDAPEEGISLTNYGLVLPGRDRLLNTTDDIYIRDGLRSEPQAASPQGSPTQLKVGTGGSQ